jgi:hypothetical protein
MALYCFECGVEVPESQKIVRNGRVFCSAAHTTTTRRTPAPRQMEQAAQPAPAQTVAGTKPTEAAKPVAAKPPVVKM